MDAPDMHAFSLEQLRTALGGAGPNGVTLDGGVHPKQTGDFNAGRHVAKDAAWTQDEARDGMRDVVSAECAKLREYLEHFLVEAWTIQLTRLLEQFRVSDEAQRKLREAQHTAIGRQLHELRQAMSSGVTPGVPSNLVVGPPLAKQIAAVGRLQHFDMEQSHSLGGSAGQPPRAPSPRVVGGGADLQARGTDDLTHDYYLEESYDHRRIEDKIQAGVKDILTVTPNYRKKAIAAVMRGHAAHHKALEDMNGWNTEVANVQDEIIETRKNWNACLRIVTHDWFDGICGFIILCNAVFIGIKMNYLMAQVKIGSTTEVEAFFWIELSFTFSFVIEYLMRVGAYRSRFFSVGQYRWHFFDSILVGLSVFESVTQLVGGDSAGFAMILRIIRFVRVVRLIRIVRVVGAFRELRLMILGMLHSLMSLLWAIIFLLIIVYFFSILFLQGVYVYCSSSDYDDHTRSELLEHYGSIAQTLLSLFMAISGGTDWITLMNPLNEIAWWYGMLFCLYVAVTCYGVLNVMTGIFVESAIGTARMDKDTTIKDELARKDSYMKSIRKLFKEADVDNTGAMSWEEFRRLIQDKRMQAYFATLEIDVTEARGLFRLLDTDESDTVSYDEFIVGCFRLKGQAKELDLATLMYENKKLITILSRFMCFSEQEFHKFELCFDFILQRLGITGIDLAQDLASSPMGGSPSGALRREEDKPAASEPQNL
jgi:voltage-gated sodium channel